MQVNCQQFRHFWLHLAFTRELIDGVAIAACNAAASPAVAELHLEAKEPSTAAPELHLEAKEPAQQCLPSGRGTAVVTSDHDGVVIAAGDAAASSAAAELHLEAKEPSTAAAELHLEAKEPA
jgi:hypothetical protein